MPLKHSCPSCCQEPASEGKRRAGSVCLCYSMLPLTQIYLTTSVEKVSSSKADWVSGSSTCFKLVSVPVTDRPGNSMWLRHCFLSGCSTLIWCISTYPVKLVGTAVHGTRLAAIQKDSYQLQQRDHENERWMVTIVNDILNQVYFAFTRPNTCSCFKTLTTLKLLRKLDGRFDFASSLSATYCSEIL